MQRKTRKDSEEGEEISRTRKAWEEVPDNTEIKSIFELGPYNLDSVIRDVKHLGFTLARYKFASKMMKKCKRIVEVGCGEGMGVFSFLSETNAEVTAIDFDESHIEYVNKNVLPYTRGRVKFVCQDIITQSYRGKKADGIICLDVIEHIHPDEERQFFENYVSILGKKGISILGTPNKYASQYASERSMIGHINLFTPERLTSTLEKYFTHTFLFSMNDEIVHTGYDKMAHYLMALSIK